MEKHKTIREERRDRLEPNRMAKAREELRKRSIPFVQVDDRKIEFEYGGHVNTYFPCTGWATGKGIKDGRGLRNLLKQMK